MKPPIEPNNVAPHSDVVLFCLAKSRVCESAVIKTVNFILIARSSLFAFLFFKAFLKFKIYGICQTQNIYWKEWRIRGEIDER